MKVLLLFIEPQSHLGSHIPRILTEQDFGESLALLLDGADLCTVWEATFSDLAVCFYLLTSKHWNCTSPRHADGRRARLYLGKLSEYTEGPNGA